MTRASRIDFVHRKLLILAQMYVDVTKGFQFSHLPHINGELDLLNALRNMYKGKLLYFDVGSYTGTYTDFVLEVFTEYEGHLFEISQPTFEICLERLGHDKRLTINNVGLSDSIGDVEYCHYPEHPTRSGISGVYVERSYAFEIETARCTTGDTYCSQKGIDQIDFLKIDAEGYDLHVLRGFENMLASGAIDVIQFEYTYFHGDVHVAMRDFYEYLTGHGYRLGPLRQWGVQFKEFGSRDNMYDNGPNFVACRPETCEALSNFEQLRQYSPKPL